MEMKLRDGEYVPDGNGGYERAKGYEELLERALFRLSARRGGFAPMPEVGSRLYTLIKLKRSEREMAAKQFAAEALYGLDLGIGDVNVSETDDGLNVRFWLYSGDNGAYADITLYSDGRDEQ